MSRSWWLAGTEKARPFWRRAGFYLLSTSEKKARSVSHKNVRISRLKPINNRYLAHSLADAGLVVFPCREAGPKGVIKAPYTKRGFKDASADHDQIDEWWDRWPEAVPGLPTGRKNGFSVLDIDMGHGDGRNGHLAIGEFGFVASQLSHLRVMTAGGGEHIYMRHEDGITNSAAHLPTGIDVRSEGGYVIAPGAKMSDGSSYEYANYNTLIDDVIGLPTFPGRLRTPERKERASANDNALELTFRDVKAVVREWLEINDIERRDAWVKLGMALSDWSDGGGNGFDIWCQASEGTDFYKRHPEQAYRELTQQWDSFDREYSGEPVTMASLMRDAPDSDYEMRRRECIADFEALDALEPPRTALTILTPDDCDIGSHNPYVVKGLFGAGETATIVGAPGVGKSALAARLAYAVAQGESAFGMRTRQGKVFYLACENETDMKRRVKALRDQYGPADHFQLFLDGGGNLKSGSRFHRDLLKEIERQRPALVVIDTFAAAMPGFEENSSEGMGQAIAVAKSLGKWGAAVIIVHHDTKAGDGLPRGHSSLNGIVDVNLALRRNEDGVITGQCSKNRSGKSHEQIIAYQNKVVELGVDQDGDAITTVICDEIQSHERAPERLPDGPANAFEILESLASGSSTVMLDAWRSACIASPWLASIDKPDTKRKTWRRARDELEKRDWIALRGDLVQLTDPSRTRCTPEDFEDEPIRRRTRQDIQELI